MKIAQKYSHLNGEEYLIVHHNNLYEEIKKVIETINASDYKTKISKAKKRLNPEQVYKVMRQGRNSPPVPLLILGIEPEDL